MMLGDPDVVEPVSLGADRGIDRPPQGLVVVLAGKPARQKENPEPQHLLCIVRAASGPTSPRMDRAGQWLGPAAVDSSPWLVVR